MIASTSLKDTAQDCQLTMTPNFASPTSISASSCMLWHDMAAPILRRPLSRSASSHRRLVSLQDFSSGDENHGDVDALYLPLWDRDDGDTVGRHPSDTGTALTTTTTTTHDVRLAHRPDPTRECY